MTHRSMLFAPLALLALASAARAQAVPPAPGELVISEIMFTPVCPGSNQNTGEWFEVTNISAKVLDVNGLYFQDGPYAGSGGANKYFQVLPSVATLPPLYPGQKFLFARSSDPNSASALWNGGLPPVDYVYCSGGVVPADHSQVAQAGMNFSSQDIDGMHISIGAPAALGGTVIDSATYNPAVYPFALPFQGGGSVERVNLFAPMLVDTTSNANSTNCALALSTATYGNCLPPFQDWGTPGARNSTDASVWPMFAPYSDSLGQNTGVLVGGDAPPSVHSGEGKFRLSGGVPLGNYTFGYAPFSGELYISPFLPGNAGAFVIDLFTGNFLSYPSFIFDGIGKADLSVAIPNYAPFVGQTFYVQWFTLEPTLFQVVFSNGLGVTITE